MYMDMDNENRIPTRRVLSNIAFVVKFICTTNKRLLLVRIPLIILQTVSPLVSFYIIRIIVNELSLNTGTVSSVLLLSACLAGANLLLSSLTRCFYLWDKCQLEYTNLNVRLILAKAVAGITYSDLETPRIRDFISLAESSDSILTMIDNISHFINSLIKVGTYSAIIFSVEPIIVAIVIVVLIIQVLLNRIKRNAEFKWRVKQAPIYRKMLYFLNIFSDMHYGKEMRVYRLQDYFTAKTTEYFDEKFLPNLKRSAFEGEGLSFLSSVFLIIQRFLFYVVLGYNVVFKEMLVGDFLFYISSVNNLTAALAEMVDRYSNLMENGAFVNEFRYCLELNNSSLSQTEKTADITVSDLTIEFKNVSFRYPGSENFVLKNINLKIVQGNRISLVGINGSGKTTMVNLLCRFYKPTEGKILIGGNDINEIPYDEYVKLIGVVFQDFKLFSFSVSENIAMDTSADEEKLANSIESSGIKEKVDNLPKGVNTFIFKEYDADGIEFSGGEGQLVAIARTIYKDTPIVILDEPTSFLDPIAEYEIYKRFDTLASGKTAIYISHRLSSTRFTDQIVVINDGEIAEMGTHHELMNKCNGIYKEMYNIQKEYYVNR